MDIILKNAGKKFYGEWIFRKLNISFQSGERVVILGPNGSGKSTLLQLLSGSIAPTEGEAIYSIQGVNIDPEDAYKELSISAPYLELIEEFTLSEIIDLHFRFKKISSTVRGSVLAETGLPEKKKSIYKYFSSGMKQRVKLALAFCSETSVLVLDEPCSNLDQSGIDWYSMMVEHHGKGRLILVASNTLKEEYAFCNRIINIKEIKG